VTLANFYRDGHRDALTGRGVLCQHSDYLAGYRAGLQERAAAALIVAGANRRGSR
jgi:hypothetical protein